MPILEVEIVGSASASPSHLAARISDAAATVFGSAPGSTWVKLRFLGRDVYAENGGGPEDGVEPVFVSVLKAAPPSDSALAAEARALCTAIAACCARPAENVHLLYLPPARGRIAFGGELRR